MGSNHSYRMPVSARHFSTRHRAAHVDWERQPLVGGGTRHRHKVRWHGYAIAFAIGALIGLLI